MDNILHILYQSPMFAIIGRASYDKDTGRHIVDDAMVMAINYGVLPPQFQGGGPRYTRDFNLSPVLGATGPTRVYVPGGQVMFGPVEVNDAQVIDFYANTIKALAEQAKKAAKVAAAIAETEKPPLEK